VPRQHLKKWTPETLERKSFSCSTFMLYLGVDKLYDIPHHNIIFAPDYKKNVDEIARTQTLSEDPSIYVQNASVTDESLAPPPDPRAREQGRSAIAGRVGRIRGCHDAGGVRDDGLAIEVALCSAHLLEEIPHSCARPFVTRGGLRSDEDSSDLRVTRGRCWNESPEGRDCDDVREPHARSGPCEQEDDFVSGSRLPLFLPENLELT